MFWPLAGLTDAFNAMIYSHSCPNAEVVELVDTRS